MLRRILVGLAIVFCLAPRLGHAVPIVTAGSGPVPVLKNVSDIFTIPISITGAVDLTSFQFDLSFNAGVLQANTAGATAGSFLPADWFFTSPGAVDNTGGHILGVSANGSAVSGSGVLANIEFKALMVGVSPLTVSNVCLNFSCNLGTDFLLVNGSVIVGPQGAPVPEPSTLSLLGVWLAAWGMYGAALRRRRQRGVQALRRVDLPHPTRPTRFGRCRMRLSPSDTVSSPS